MKQFVAETRKKLNNGNEHKCFRYGFVRSLMFHSHGVHFILVFFDLEIKYGIHFFRSSSSFNASKDRRGMTFNLDYHRQHHRNNPPSNALVSSKEMAETVWKSQTHNTKSNGCVIENAEKKCFC